MWQILSNGLYILLRIYSEFCCPRSQFSFKSARRSAQAPKLSLALRLRAWGGFWGRLMKYPCRFNRVTNPDADSPPEKRLSLSLSLYPLRAQSSTMQRTRQNILSLFRLLFFIDTTRSQHLIMYQFSLYFIIFSCIFIINYKNNIILILAVIMRRGY